MGAGRLGIAKNAAFEPARRIVEQFVAVRAQRARWLVMRAAVHAQHDRQRFQLARAPFSGRVGDKTDGLARHARTQPRIIVNNILNCSVATTA